MSERLRYGLIGCGGFGRFCLEQYRAMPEVRCVAVADADPALAQTLAGQFAIVACDSPEALLARDDVDLVHIATPPWTHAPLCLAALEAGKHVLCEKPLAITREDANAMVALAREKQRLLAVNLIMRYNPLCAAVKAIIEGGFLGEPLHAHFINDAKDEQLTPGHWFWVRAQSGGIFIEHGVHFFDLFEWWFGPGQILAAAQTTRPGTALVEHVHCTARYGDSILAEFYHGFHQASRMDHQEWKLVFEMGSIEMREWVPTTLRIDLLARDTTIAALGKLLPMAEVTTLERYQGAARHCTSRHQAREVDGHFSISTHAGFEKMDLYGEMLRALMSDQISVIRNSSHQRRITETNGVTSLEMAVAAQSAADVSGGH
ncbi:MAG: hypothetical protein QOD99_666 [Chthoniobacter sp.]|jgi:predicted dehydrogenase|nr:hypothetical protein [Chthoniobacter sp.]